jgi:hypothetical protein
MNLTRLAGRGARLPAAALEDVNVWVLVGAGALAIKFKKDTS